jgi:hypothetical protein
MSTRVVVAVLAMGCVAAPVMADHAQPRGGGGSGQSSAGARHPSGSGSSGGGSGGGYHGDSSGGAVPRSPAEQRHPRPGSGSGYYPGYGYGHYPYYPYYGGGYYSYWPYYYGSWWPYYGYYGGYAYGYPAYGGGYAPPGYAPPYYSERYGNQSAALRVFVEPEKTKVFVDGYYAGVADDFDGLTQRLYVSPGRHEITLKLDGYRSHRVRIFVTPGSTSKIEHDMAKGAGEETLEDLSGGRYDKEPAPAERYDRAPPSQERYDNVPPPQERYDEGAPPPSSDRPSNRMMMEDGSYAPQPGRLRLDVRPADSSVYVDGEFKGMAGQVGVVVLPAGPHRVEVVRPGFRTEERDMDLAPGATKDVRVELQRP